MAKPTRYTPETFRAYVQEGYWEHATLSDYWNRAASECPDAEAIADSRTRLTWSQANRWIDRLALGFLDLGIQRDELLLVALYPCVELTLLRVACERAGIVCLPMPMNWRHREVEHVLNLARPVAIVSPLQFRRFDYLAMFRQLGSSARYLRHILLTGEETAPGTVSIREMVNRPIEERYPRKHLESTKTRADEFSLVVATTGTTGFPKLVENPVCSRIYMAKAFIKRYQVTAADTIGILVPAVGGLNHVAYFGAPMLPAKVVILEHFTPEGAFSLIERERITFAGAVPASLAQMVRDPSRSKYDLSSMRLMNSTASAMTFELGMQVEQELGFPVVQTYASMDSGGATCVSFNDPPEVLYRTGGKPFDGNEIRILDHVGNEVLPGEIGEINVRGPTTVSGYYKDPESTWAVWNQDGWYKTGDLGFVQPDGNLVVAGRKRDMIMRGGQNIYPIEIENLLLTHPKVADVAVVAMPCPVMGERCCAYVVPRPSNDFSFEEMISYLKSKHLAPYKLPERLELATALPKVGEQRKTDKKALQRDLREKLRRETTR